MAHTVAIHFTLGLITRGHVIAKADVHWYGMITIVMIKIPPQQVSPWPSMLLLVVTPRIYDRVWRTVIVRIGGFVFFPERLIVPAR